MITKALLVGITLLGLVSGSDARTTQAFRVKKDQPLSDQPFFVANEDCSLHVYMSSKLSAEEIQRTQLILRYLYSRTDTDFYRFYGCKRPLPTQSASTMDLPKLCGSLLPHIGWEMAQALYMEKFKNWAGPELIALLERAPTEQELGLLTGDQFSDRYRKIHESLRSKGVTLMLVKTTECH